MHERYDDFPLRARKRARTRVELVQALLVRLSERSLDDISVAELCHEVSISEGTFYNYFPTKTLLLAHYIQLWSLEVGLVALRARQQTSNPLAAIEAFFQATAKEVSVHPRVMFEIIAHQARSGVEALEPVEDVERLLFLDDAPEARDLPDGGLDTLLVAWVGEAVAQGDLPPATEVMEVVLAAGSVFFGVPLLIGRETPELIGPLYAGQLALIWDGARVRYG